MQENKGIASFYMDQEWNGTNYVSDGVADDFFQLGPDLEGFLLGVLAAIPDPEDEAESHGLPN